MIICVPRKRKPKKYMVPLNEIEIRYICEALNEKTEKLMSENNLDSEIKGHRLDLIIQKFLKYMN